MKDKFMRFMAGRYGGDQFSRFLSIVTLVLLVVSMFLGRTVVYVPVMAVAWALLFYSLFRIFSRNIQARYRENEKYLQIKGKTTNFFAVKKSHFTQRKYYRFYRCPKCGQQVRVPKGKGHIRITCPKCRAEFDKTT